MAHTHTQRKPRPVHLNAIEIAINRARKLSSADVSMQSNIMRNALAGLKTGPHQAQHWRSLADTANVAETFEAMGLGSGPQAQQVIDAAQHALAAIQQRHQARGSWALYAAEVDALEMLVALHAVQLAACSYGEFETALTTTHNRVAQARAGNAPAGAIVITGDIA